MYDQVLFPTDGSERSDSAFEHALEVAADHGATIHILHVADTTRESVTRLRGDVVDVLEREGERIVEETAERAEKRGVPTVTEVHQGGVPETIVEYADSYDIDLIVMPTRGRAGLERVLLGSVTERVMRRAPVPVLTVPGV